MLSSQVLEALAHVEALDRVQKDSGRGLPFWRISAASGRLLYILVRAAGARQAIEVGTSSGYSGIYIAAALQDTGGHLWTLDREPAKVQLARENFHRAGVQDRITQVEGDALHTLPQVMASCPGPVDFAFLDAVKSDYVRYLELIRPRLRPGSIICADNVTRQATAVRAYLDAVAQPPFVTTVVPTVNSEDEADGLAVTVVAGGGA